MAVSVTVGLSLAVIGLIVFNLGLTYGLINLGAQCGAMVPAAFAEMPGVPSSPLFSRQVGLVVTVCFGFFLGLGATLAEPALSALGDSVQVLTNGRFKKKVLIGAVALGVAVGVVLGIVRIVYQLRLTYILLSGYLVTLMLTACSSDDYAAIAWDSAGVTTGPVSAFCHLMALA